MSKEKRGKQVWVYALAIVLGIVLILFLNLLQVKINPAGEAFYSGAYGSTYTSSQTKALLYKVFKPAKQVVYNPQCQTYSDIQNIGNESTALEDFCKSKQAYCAETIYNQFFSEHYSSDGSCNGKIFNTYSGGWFKSGCRVDVGDPLLSNACLPGVPSAQIHDRSRYARLTKITCCK